MNPRPPWQLFRPLTMACLVAIVILTVIRLYLKTSYYRVFDEPFEIWGPYLWSDGIPAIWVHGRTVLPPALLLLLAFFVSKRVPLVPSAIGRYGYRRVGVVAYFLMAIGFSLVDAAIFGPLGNSWHFLLRFVVIISPGLFLLTWWGMRWLIAHLRPLEVN
jgi:hypothetical protein